LITGSRDKRVKRISVENREVDKVFEHYSGNVITTMKITADGEKLLVGDFRGHLKLTSLTDGKVIKNFGKCHGRGISGIMITMD
jgi:hypothetical protein